MLLWGFCLSALFTETLKQQFLLSGLVGIWYCSPLGGLRNPTQENRTHPKILPSQVTIAEGKTWSRISLRILSTQIAARIWGDVSVAVEVGEVWKQQKSTSGWASSFPSRGRAKLWKRENKRQTGEQGKKVLERNFLLQEAQWFVVKQTAVLLFPC